MDAAVKANDVYAPLDIVTAVPVPSVAGVQFHPRATVHSSQPASDPALAGWQAGLAALSFPAQVGPRRSGWERGGVCFFLHIKILKTPPRHSPFFGTPSLTK